MQGGAGEVEEEEEVSREGNEAAAGQAAASGHLEVGTVCACTWNPIIVSMGHVLGVKMEM